MKLIKGKDSICKECKALICCATPREPYSHKYCFNCGVKIKWVEERTAEEVLEELLFLWGADGMDETADDLKQELLNIIKK